MFTPETGADRRARLTALQAERFATLVREHLRERDVTTAEALTELWLTEDRERAELRAAQRAALATFEIERVKRTALEEIQTEEG